LSKDGIGLFWFRAVFLKNEQMESSTKDPLCCYREWAMDK